MDYDASGKLLLEHHGNGIGTQNRYHPTRGFLWRRGTGCNCFHEKAVNG